MRDEDFAALGYFVGGRAGDLIPVIRGVPEATFDQLKYLSAGVGSTGSVALYHVIGITPEARAFEDAFQGGEQEQVTRFDAAELQSTKGRMSTFSEGPVDVVGLGCPHASIAQVKRYVELLAGRRVHANTELWVCMNETVEAMARRMGYVTALQMSGARIMTGTCLNDCPLDAWHFRRLATDSAKFAYYTPTTVGSECHFTGTESCIEAAIRGSIGGEGNG